MARTKSDPDSRIAESYRKDCNLHLICGYQ